MKFGLYVHVPFCRDICPYCDFNVRKLNGDPWPAFVDAVCQEMQLRAPMFLNFAPGGLQTIYFGGGTPSLMPAWGFEKILKHAQSLLYWPQERRVEITAEVQPGTASLAQFKAWRGLGINRISLGWQSTNAKSLKILGRRHDVQTNLQTFADARKAGFDNISLDLMFATPGQTLNALQRDLAHIGEIKPEHVSLYALTWAEGTPFFKRRAQKRLTAVSDDMQCEMMDLIDHHLESLCFERYEVSNYAQQGLRAQHNANYWTLTPCMGLGPGAHSLLRDGVQRGWRWQSIRAPSRYMQHFSQSFGHTQPTRVPSKTQDLEDFEDLVPATMLLERILAGLRTKDGVALDEGFVAGQRSRVVATAATLLKNGWAFIKDGRLMPTHEGLKFADSAALLFA